MVATRRVRRLRVRPQARAGVDMSGEAPHENMICADYRQALIAAFMVLPFGVQYVTIRQLLIDWLDLHEQSENEPMIAATLAAMGDARDYMPKREP